ncbi:DUF1214 domain-containing protein [Hoeflea prorocentri]|uniref:DUF1214 domain-containing protein n=1 Tax=Hoeflea prorocentri TaxID=1922333 RepID=A0A9X3UHI8_9HYPH|nr:DUF1214 domain-containing protein [Hoeflea prorocentri]MCY6381513.1 DUF1214 domain-containing protein [Hoeflea prorocentri]MDA5399313.1 DUF1214 domain-containing protein [Hoeflea prorocentri]
MFRVPATIAAIFVIAFGGAMLSAAYALKATVGFGSISLGPWKAWPHAQTEKADPYAKAHRARAGRLLLGGAEGLVFIAGADSSGARLQTGCDYTIQGQTPPARFWTLHVTDNDDSLLPVDQVFPAAYHSQNVLKQQNGTFEITASTLPRSGNWLALDGQDQPFKLVLTLFDTPTAGSSRLIELQMPQIVAGECRDG